MKTLKQIKQITTDLVAEAINRLVSDLKKTESFELLTKELNDFEWDPYTNADFYLDESGYLNSKIDLDLSGFNEEDVEVLHTLLEESNDMIRYEQDQYSQGPHQWSAHICLGEPIIFNENPERNHYAIYSNELNLKIDSVINETHGLMLIEQKMRQVGVFENIVSTDYYGNFRAFESIPKHIVELSDSELQDAINRIETEEKGE